MIKKFFLLLVFLCITLSVTGCNKKQAILLFNNRPITKETVLKNSLEFKKGERIYYIFISQKPLKTKFIKVQVMKKDNKVGDWGTKIVMANDYRLSKDELYYYSDYIVLREAGHYYMLIFAKDNLDKPITKSDFYVFD